MSIKENIKKLVDVPVQVRTGKVVSVDLQKMICKVDIAGYAPRMNVRLRATIEDDKGVIAVPKQDSKVLVALIDNIPESSFVCSRSEVEKVLVNIGQHSYLIDSEGCEAKIGQTTFEAKTDGFVIKAGGKSLKDIIGNALSALSQSTVPTQAGPQPLSNFATFISLKTQLNSVLKA